MECACAHNHMYLCVYNLVSHMCIVFTWNIYLYLPFSVPTHSLVVAPFPFPLEIAVSLFFYQHHSTNLLFNHSRELNDFFTAVWIVCVWYLRLDKANLTKKKREKWWKQQIVIAPFNDFNLEYRYSLPILFLRLPPELEEIHLIIFVPFVFQ